MYGNLSDLKNLCITENEIHSLTFLIIKLTWTCMWYTLIHLLNFLNNDRRSF